jgi:hypothetical protein
MTVLRWFRPLYLETTFTAMAFTVSVGALAQGTVNMSNRFVDAYNTEIYVQTSNGRIKAAGTDYLIQLFAGPKGSMKRS